MKNLAPRHIQEAESDQRRIKDGWYATDKTGQICSGGFPVEKIAKRTLSRGRIEIESSPWAARASAPGYL